MRMFVSLAIVLTLFSFFGCKRQAKNDAAATLAEAASVEFGDARHYKEDFDRSFDILNSLNDSPSLPNSPGFEKIVSTADRLDKWIRNQKPDEIWKIDPFFQEIENAARQAANAAKQIVRSLNLLQGKEVLDDNGQPIAPTESLQNERQDVSTGLNQFVAALQTFSAKADLPTIGQYSQVVDELQKKFAALEKIPNLNAAGIRSFAKQLEQNTESFAAVATMLEQYAIQLKTDGLFISASDVEYLKQSAWMRDLSKWTCGDKRVLLEQVIQLCDWVVCNIEMRDNQLQVNQQQAVNMPQQYPWQTVLLGYGTVIDRMTVFLELLRQQRIDAAMLAVPHPNDPKVPLFWGVGVLLDGEVYVFLPDYGFPLPANGGVKTSEDGSLQFSEIATLSQLLQDDSPLRKLDVSDKQKFPITAELLKQTTAYLFVTPESVSLRMKVLEAELSGEQNMVLYTDQRELRRRFSETKGMTAIEFWKYPLRTAFEQRFASQATNDMMAVFLIPSIKRNDYPLWSGRVLYIKGLVSGQESAVTKYQNARVPDREMIEYRKNPQFRNNPLLSLQLQIITIQASYWLGTASFEMDSIAAAKDYLTGIRSSSLNTWRNNTEYILGRIAEREKRYGDARRHYENTASSLSGAGNAVRIKWLPAE